MPQAAFIDTNYIYRFTIIETNVDADLIQKFIWKGQDLNIQSAVGQNLYTKLINDCPNFTGQYLTLVRDYIQPCLAEWVVYHSLPFINFRLTNKAVSQKSSDNSQPSTVDDIRWLRDQVRNNAEFYSERIKDYIRNNPSDFPEYFTTSQSFEVRPSKTGYFSGIWTKGRNWRGPYPPINQINPDDFCC
jgi:hypothetical protein